MTDLTFDDLFNRDSWTTDDLADVVDLLSQEAGCPVSIAYTSDDGWRVGVWPIGSRAWSVSDCSLAAAICRVRRKLEAQLVG